MSLKTSIAASVLASAYTSSAIAQDNARSSEFVWQEQIGHCITEAANAVTVLNERAYYDPTDEGYKKYSETADDLIDYNRTISISFTPEGIHYIDHGNLISGDMADMISDLDAPPREISEEERRIINWVNDSANTLALHFTVCMNFEPYEPGGLFIEDTTINQPIFPTFE